MGTFLFTLLLTLSNLGWAADTAQDLDDKPVLIVVDQNIPEQVPPSAEETIEIQLALPENTPLTLKLLNYLLEKAPGKLDKAFTFLRVPENIKNFAIEEVRNKLQSSASVIPQTNANGAAARGALIVTFGLNEMFAKSFKESRAFSMQQTLVRYLKSHKMGFLVPDKAHFGFVMGFEAAVVRNSSKTVFRLSFEHEKPSRVTTWMMDMTAVGGGSKLSTFLPEKVPLFETARLERTVLGPLGFLSLGEGHFELGYVLGPSVTPVASNTYVYDTVVYQHRLNLTIHRGWVKRIYEASKKTCKDLIWNRRVNNPIF